MSHSKAVLKKIRGNYPDKKRARYLRLPSKQEYTINTNDIEIKLKKGVESENMQVDASAFEGWALVMRVWGKFNKVTLCWEKPTNIDNGHYQRFLFRAKQFHHLNKSWFSICNSCLSYLDDLKIKAQDTYFMNVPSENRVIKKPHHKEAILEFRFALKDLHSPLMTLTKANTIYRQLPVGVFEKSVANGNEIFTKGKSAIDLWGINKKSELLIFELKAEGNNKVGIISELFFYVCVMQKIIAGQFEHKANKDTNLALIPKTKRIKAYFLAYDLHPLIDPMKSPAIMKELYKMTPTQVEYHFIQIDSKDNLKLVF